METVKKQLITFIVKGILMALGAYLVSRGKLSQESADQLTQALLQNIVGIIMIVLPIVLEYFKAQKRTEFHDETIREALNSPSDTAVSLVKARAKENIQNSKT